MASLHGQAVSESGYSRPPSPELTRDAGSGGGGSSRPRDLESASKAKSVTLAGKGPMPVDKRKYRYDTVLGRASGVRFAVTKDDRMSATEAGAMLHSIHEMCGVAHENEDILAAFDKALFFCHTVNGGSVLNPGRSTFSIPGKSNEFSYEHIRNKLGIDLRRFFRAFADDITVVNREVIAAYDAYDAVSAEAYGWLMQAASERGLHRYPYLAHDSADACIHLSQVERAAVAASKVTVLSSVANSADKMRANPRTSTADNYDSSI